MHANNDLAGAARAFADLCLTHPRESVAYKSFGYVLCELGDYENAIAPLLVAAGKDPEDPTPLYLMAGCLRQTGAQDAAKQTALAAMDVARLNNRYTHLHMPIQRMIDSP